MRSTHLSRLPTATLRAELAWLTRPDATESPLVRQYADAIREELETRATDRWDLTQEETTLRDPRD